MDGGLLVVPRIDAHPFPRERAGTTLYQNSGTTQTVAIPSGAVIGDRLLLIVATVAAHTAISGGTWTQEGRVSPVGQDIGVYSKTYDGTEGGSISMTIGGTGGKFLRLAAYGNLNAAAGSIACVTRSGDTNAPLITPAWGLANTRWMAIGGIRNTGGAASFTYPPDYPLDRVSQDLAQECMAFCAKNQRATSSDPNDFIFTGGTFSGPCAISIALRPK